MSADALIHRVRPAAAAPDAALVLFHGRGTSELDLAPLIDVLDPDRRFVGVTPRGPLTLPPGGAHWYVVRRVGYPDKETFDASLELTAGWLDALLEKLGVPIERTVLGGFSQGAVMSYALGLGRGRPAPAGILALSGFIPAVEGFELDLEGRQGFPIAIGHGSHDPVIGVEFARAARERLAPAGVDLTYRESPMAHTIDPDYLAELTEWLVRAVGPYAARSAQSR